MFPRDGHQLTGCLVGPLDVVQQLVQDADRGERVRAGERMRDLATSIVRGVLLPASMKLLGAWNWYVPSWLEWLPRFGLTESEPPRETKATPASA